ncbi:MAG: dipeptidyl carboxypeptidase II [Candidatus Neomarinimicrobiota bacterium]|nr:MAG: dipeptidyl carboxypeptidase II [Candidatus Neomarinimicrobiota bacterium]
MSSTFILTLLASLGLAVLGCAGTATEDAASANPFFAESSLPFALPPFDQIDDAHYRPAFERGMADQLVEIEAIANTADTPTFENTVVQMERSGRLLTRVANVFFGLTSADTNDVLDAIETEIAPTLSAHNDQILLNDTLFARVKTLYDERDGLDLDAEARRLVEEYYTDFVRAGAQVSAAEKERLKAINAELATLGTAFSQNVLGEVNAAAVSVDTQEELAGLSKNEIAAAAEAAVARDLEGKYVIALLNTSGQPALSSLENRALRERIMAASQARGRQGGEFDNRDIVTRMARLRAERAQMLGYPNHAAYILEQQTAQTVDAVNERLASLTPPAVANAQAEAVDLQEMIGAEDGDFALAGWDWAYYTEKVRAARYAFDASQLRPYFEMNTVLTNGVFYAATQLYGLTFKERSELPVYHPDVRVFEVFDAGGAPLGLFLGDFYARPSKRGGAWMNAYVSQSHLLGTQAVVANHLNIPKPPAGEPTLLTFDEVTTMFHEFGHALHGLFSDVRYPYFAGTSVPRDFVEYPSQVNEMWATWPEVLTHYAVHHETGEPMPTELLDKVLATVTFNQGFATTEYLAASLLDMAWHQLSPEDVPDADGLVAFEAAALKEAGVALDAVPPRYRSTYFSHIFAGGYSAGYYSYIWSEVLDADSVEWFKEHGGLTRENGDHFRASLLSRGGSVEAMTLFRNFRGADPDITPLLTRRGLN